MVENVNSEFKIDHRAIEHTIDQLNVLKTRVSGIEIGVNHIVLDDCGVSLTGPCGAVEDSIFVLENDITKIKEEYNLMIDATIAYLQKTDDDFKEIDVYKEKA